MSAYITLMTPMMDPECLVAALADLGFDRTKVEIHESPVHLVGYRGDRREQRATIVIRRQYVSGSSNDVGFLATPTGYQALISDFDRSRFGSSWIAQLHERYQVHSATKQEHLAEDARRQLKEERHRLVEAQRAAVHEKAKKLGYQVKETREGETLRLVLMKRSY